MCDAWAFLFNFSKYRKVPHNHAGDKERERICEQSPPCAVGSDDDSTSKGADDVTDIGH